MAVFAPFDFARIGRWVYAPDWGPLVSHDVPFSDGLSGTAMVTITARTPLLVGGERRGATEHRHGEVWPFRLPDGTWALPPSTLHGHVRTLLEIAGFGRLGDVVEERRFGYRDLSPSRSAKEHYISRLTHREQGVIHPDSQAGWMIKDRNDKIVKVIPCQMARIHINDLRRMRATLQNLSFHAGHVAEAADKFWHWRGSDAQERYGHFLGKTSSKAGLESTFAVQPTTNHPHSRGLVIHYARCVPSVEAAAKPGTIIVTGRTRRREDAPHDGPGQKKQEFVFFGPSRSEVPTWTGRQPLQVPDLAWGAFLQMHDEQRGKQINPSWEFWKKDFDEGLPVPVFYWMNAEGEIDTLGMAFAFKAAQTLTPRDLLKNSHSNHVVDATDAPLDLASLILGTAGDGNKGRGLRRRAWFGLARDASGQRNRQPADLGNNAVLMSPKPSYANFYVRQPPAQGDTTPQDRPMAMFNAVADYPQTGTYLSLPELSGVKIWPATEDGADLTLPAPVVAQKQVQTRLNAVPAGTTFTAPLTFHNLRPVELGALLWVLSFGEDAAFRQDSAAVRRRHRLGMGKPYALGQVGLQLDLTVDPEDDPESTWSPQTLIKAFVDHMNDQYPKKDHWSESPQVRALLKASLPAARKRGAGGQPYMPLGNPKIAETYVGEKVAGGFLAAFADSAFEVDKPPPQHGRDQEALGPVNPRSVPGPQDPFTARETAPATPAAPRSGPMDFRQGDKVKVTGGNPEISGDTGIVTGTPLTSDPRVKVRIGERQFTPKREHLTRIDPPA